MKNRSLALDLNSPPKLIHQSSAFANILMRGLSYHVELVDVFYAVSLMG